MNAKRVFDICFSLIGICTLTPLFLVVAALLKHDSKGPLFYRQVRVGLHLKTFKLIKFRSMYPDSEAAGLLTVGGHDARITKFGTWLRKYKIDELPQLFNVLRGEMSLVGPRPEVPKYVALYNADQKKVLNVKPGITDWASVYYLEESDMLAATDDPEKYYISTIMPSKISWNLAYAEHHNLWVDIRIILYTLKHIMIQWKH